MRHKIEIKPNSLVEIAPYYFYKVEFTRMLIHICIMEILLFTKVPIQTIRLKVNIHSLIKKRKKYNKQLFQLL